MEIVCEDYIPNIGEYIKAFDALQYLFLSISGICMIGTLIITGFSLYHTISFVAPEFRQFNIKILLVYPIVAICSFTRILVPRANLFLHSVAFVTYCFSSFSFIKLCTAYIETDKQFVENARPDAFRIRRPPICCLFFCLKDTPVTLKKILISKILVLQLSIVIPILLLIQNIMFIENEQMYNNTLLYFVPFFAISILLSVWGLNIYSQMISPYLPGEFHVGTKYIVLQLVLVSLKFQAVIGYLIIVSGMFECHPPLTPTISKNIFINFVICMEMFALSLWARHLYRKPTYHMSDL